MSAGDIFKKRLKASAASLGTGTPSESTFLRGDGAWEATVASSDVSNLENTLTMIAWDTYSADNTFDDIYIDDFTDATGIDGTVSASTALTGNSTGVYDSGNSLVKTFAASTGATVDVTTSQIKCTAWSDINSVAITQTTPGDATVSAIYHAVSFDNAVTYKVFKTTWQTVAYNNGGTWQYNNAGSLTNASSNTLAQALIQSTDQSAYQWTKTNIEAMADADWNESGGWTTSVTTVDWAHRDVTGVTVTGTGSGYSTAPMTSNTTSSSGTPGIITATDYHYDGDTYAVWHIFDQNTSSAFYMDAGFSIGTSTPWCVVYDFGSGYEKIINSYGVATGNNGHQLSAWKLQGSNTGVYDSDTGWTDLDSQTAQSGYTNNTLYTFSFSNVVAYQKYRLRVTGYTTRADGLSISEIQLTAATTATATPTFTKSTVNHDTDHIPLSLISNSWEASVNDPTDAYCVLDVEPVDSITLNTDLLAYASIDNGAHYEQITLEATPFREIGDHDYVRGDLSGITARTDKTIRIKVTVQIVKPLNYMLGQ